MLGRDKTGTIILIDGYQFEYILHNGCHYMLGIDDVVKTIIVTKRYTENALSKIIDVTRATMYLVFEKNKSMVN